ncbi:alkaline phosphatase family protein [Thermobrachium celere]|uniref:alkaline phosphatase family protein n=1 Tax=Thermobrachium celere TaxID=53422 RepID=UPI001940C2B3|nr:alkaline phosphatase family protein [Thermobrachium celere]GFR35201.1 hypothetical protein TCEA9_10130 [Thermobrachium celere]
MSNIQFAFLLYILILNSTITLFKHTFYDITTTNRLTNNKICLIIVDGLRLDAINNMPYIQNLIKTNEAKFSISIADNPTISRSGYMRILTGCPTDISGISSNSQHLPSPILGVPQLAVQYNIKTALCGYYWIYELFPFAFYFKRIYFIRDGTTFKNAYSIIDEYEPDFLIVHPMSVDNIGHSYGGSSIFYFKEACNIDNSIKALCNKLQKHNYNIIITSDHGHQNYGGHTNYEPNTFLTPFILISNNLNINPPLYIKQIDIAPTLCDLLGIPKTLYMTGNSLINNKDIIYLRRLHIYDFNRSFDYNLNLSILITNIILLIHLIVYYYIICLIKKLIK